MPALSVFVDEQAFLDHAVVAIQAELHRLLVAGIRYEKLVLGTPDSEWEMTAAGSTASRHGRIALIM